MKRESRRAQTSAHPHRVAARTASPSGATRHATAMEIRPVNGDEFPAFLRTTEGAFHEDVTDEDVASLGDGLRARAQPGRLRRRRDGRDRRHLHARADDPRGADERRGVTAVGVLPTHRRRGLLTALMRRQLDDVRAAGESVAALWASEPVIYGRFGYGLAARHAASPRCATTGARLRAGLPAPAGRTVLLEPADAVERIAPLYDRVRRERVGHLDRTGAWWDLRVYDPEAHRNGRGAAARRRPRGARRDRRRLCALRRQARLERRRAGLGRRRPRAGRRRPRGGRRVLVLPPRPRPDPQHRGLARRARLAAERDRRGPAAPAHRRSGQNLWVRLVDVGAALAARTYSAPFEAVFEVADAFCPWNAGRHRLAWDGAAAVCERDRRRRRPRADGGRPGRRVPRRHEPRRARRDRPRARAAGRCARTRSRPRSGSRASRGAREIF